MDIGFKTRKQSSPVTLPIELIFSCILPKLPAKSLLRFKCVSKSFLTEISSDKFNASFSETNQFLILSGEPNTFCIYKLDSSNSPPTICPYPISSKLYAPLLASCESYLLIGFSNIHHWPQALVLLNPITRIYRILPKVGIPDFYDNVTYGMCHCLDDEFNNDFKVVRFVKYEGPHENDLREIKIYSLRANSWRTIEESETSTAQWMSIPVLVHNNLLAMIFYDDDDRLTRIGCFDIKAERWSNDVLLPDTISGEISSNSFRDGHYYYLGVLDGKLHFSWYDMNRATYTTWVMKKYGDKSSWVKLMSLPAKGLKEVYHPIAYGKGSSHELLCISNNNAKYFWYNLRDKRTTETKFDNDDEPDTNYLRSACICKGSLLNFPGGKPIHSASNEQEVDGDNDDGEYCYVEYGY